MTAHARSSTIEAPPAQPVNVPSSAVDVAMTYQPVLDVARGVAAGYHAVAQVPHGWPTDGDGRRRLTTATITAAMAARATLPVNTFISIPVPLDLLDDPEVGTLLAAHGDLRGVVLDITEFQSSVAASAESAIDDLKLSGASIAVGGHGGAQPELGSIVRLRPAIIRLGDAWTRGIDQHPSRRSAIEVTGRLAGQLDAWILADDIATAGELRVLAELGVPLARGPFVGDPQSVWPEIGDDARTTLPPRGRPPDGALRSLLQEAYTTRDMAAARSVLPEASGFQSVVVVDDASHPVCLLQRGTFGRWEPVEALTVNVDTPVTQAVARAMSRPPETRFSPITCTDDAGRFVGILRIERLMDHLVGES